LSRTKKNNAQFVQNSKKLIYFVMVKTHFSPSIPTAVSEFMLHSPRSISNENWSFDLSKDKFDLQDEAWIPFICAADSKLHIGRLPKALALIAPEIYNWIS
jgi:hypothetical protein